MLLTRFEQKNGHLAQVEVDEVFGFMCHVTTEVPPHDAVPGPPPAPRPHLLNMGRNVLLYVIFLQRLSSTLHRILLHLFGHVGIFDHRLSVAHGYLGDEGWPTATVSWGRGWRGSDPAGEAVATEAVAHLRSPTPVAAA
uniref:Uncharacterized protein n=1 Tax=Rhinolophus ferrumequinum TaxID=59479 RepID=A0A671FB26_RHIFE